MARKEQETVYDKDGNPVFIDKKKKGGCLKWILIAFGIIILLAACEAMLGGDEEEKASDTTTSTSTSTPSTSEDDSTDDSTEETGTEEATEEVTEESEEVEEVTEEVEKVTEETEEISKKSKTTEALFAEMFKINLEENMGHLVDVHYDEKEKMYQLVAHDETLKNALITVALGIDMPEWKNLVDSQIELSQTLLDTVGPGYTIAIANPENTENNFLVIVDGEVLYDVSVSD